MGMGFDFEHDFAPTTVFLGLLFALALFFLWGGIGVQHSIISCKVIISNLNSLTCDLN